MPRRLNLLPFALCAGLAAVIAAAVPLFASVLPTQTPTQIRYTKTTSIEMPKAIQMFMHHAGSTSTTTTIAGERARIDEGDTSTITECDLQRVIHLDNKAKTYWTASFDDMMKQMQAMMKQAQSQQPMAHPSPQGTPQQIKGTGDITFSVSEIPDDQTQTLFGMTAHHLINTVTMTAKGTGDCPNFSMTIKSDQWWVPNELPKACPLPVRPPGPPQGAGGPPQGGGQQNPCMSKFGMQAQLKAHPANRFVLKDTTTTSIGSSSGSASFPVHEDVTAYATTPFDATVFDIPAGYTQVPPPSAPNN
jgi:hypothetical protein